MNGDASDSVLNSHICFNALATLQHLKNVENSCSFCSASDHSTYICPVLSQGEHVKDTSIQNMSRSSVPHGLQVYENDTGAHIISGQKFAKGCRFGPLLAPKSYIPIVNVKFPLAIFGNVNLDMDGINMPELKELFKVRHIYLDTRDENNCNWMIHVDPATCVNEQNLIAYEEDNEIFFAAIEDLDFGDILKVWYAPKYAERMNVELLKWSPHPIVKNVFNENGALMPEFQFLNNSHAIERHTNRTEIPLPPIRSLIKPSVYVCYENRNFPLASTIPMGQMLTSPQLLNHTITTSAEPTYDERNSDMYYMNHVMDMELNNVLPEGQLALNSTYISTSAPYLHETDDDLGDGLHDIVSANSSSSFNSDKEEKKIYPCQLCDKKYSTMTNIYRHVRAQHNYFLCSLCMNMFQLEIELKDHMHRCPKSDVKKPQCSVCMQYFSNSWSLTRHVKIHVSAGECDADVLVDKRSKDKKKIDSKDSMDLSDFEKNSRDSLATESSSIAIEPAVLSMDPSAIVMELPTVSAIKTEPILSVPLLCNFETDNGLESMSSDIPSIHKSESSTSIDVCGADEVSTCIVCEKKFKSKTYMNKHLRSVHTVKILTSTKRPTNGGHSSKSATSQSKRSTTSDINPAVTVTGAPVNPLTAKALASKLNERNNQLLNKPMSKMVVTQPAVTTVTQKGEPIPPLVSLNNTHSHSDGTENISPIMLDMVGQEANLTTHMYNSEDFEPELNVPTFNILKKAMHNNHNGVENVDYDMTPFHNTSSNDIGLRNAANISKLHSCDMCEKKFSKKYELKRHKAVHENIIFHCSYCPKEVKRKPSMIKHLRHSHKDLEHIWGQSNFIESLKKITDANIEDRSQSPSSSGSPTFHELIVQPKALILGATPSLAHDIAPKRKYLLNNNNVTKPKKSLKEKSRDLPKLAKKPKKSGKNDDSIKKVTKSKAKSKPPKLVCGDGIISGSQPLNTNTEIDFNINHTYTLGSSAVSAANDRIGAITNGIQVNYLIQTDNMVTSTNALAECDATNVKNSKLEMNHLATTASEMASAAAVLLSAASSADTLIGQPQVINNNQSNNTDYANIIDNCFFAEDTMNCNGMLNSPFSSDNDVDGFIIANSNEGSTSNKELLNKFHDRLEEIEKIENSEYKLYWNGESDDDNEDDAINGVDDEDDTVDQSDATAMGTMIVPKAQFNEFV